MKEWMNFNRYFIIFINQDDSLRIQIDFTIFVLFN